jgi:1,4-dihydroxy-2-naphthoate octaprenyltransferase
MNVEMWLKAIRIIPRLDKEEWDHLDVISRWLIATRFAVVIMTFISAAIAGLWAYRDGHFVVLYWLLTTFGLMMAHATNNILNDITDFKKGVDQDNYFRTQYGPQPLAHGLMTMRQSLTYAAVTGSIALATGLYLAFARGPLTLALLAAGAFFVLFYTYPLKYIGLGEIAVLIVWGPLMIGGAYYVSALRWDWIVVLVGLPYALGTTGVILGKHIDKLKDDAAKKIRTLPVIIGERNARLVLAGATALQYILVAGLVITGVFTPVMLVVFLAFPMFLRFFGVYMQPRPDGPPPLPQIPKSKIAELFTGQDYPPEGWPMWFVAMAFVHNRRFGMLFLLGLILDVALHLWLGL